MVSRDRRIDAYIAKAPEFARPILARLREGVHAGCPDVVETIKWRNPAFEHQGLLCGMAAFKKYCMFGFWKHELLASEDPRARETLDSLGRIASVDEMPSPTQLARFVKKAVKLNEEGVRAPRRAAAAKKAVRMHPELKAALAENARARAAFEGFPPGARREYLEWIADAKQDATRARRIAQALEWVAQGKRRNWKYERA